LTHRTPFDKPDYIVAKALAQLARAEGGNLAVGLI
jgi:hypothetical protein